jgi:hypothetical protein
MEIGVDGGWMVDGWWKGGRLVSSYFSGGFVSRTKYHKIVRDHLYPPNILLMMYI